jgi:hypothetical protein
MGTALPDLPALRLVDQKGYRLINSKLPTIDIFDDVAGPEDFDALYALQALTNPRLAQEVGQLSYLSQSEIPWGIPGCSLAVAPFTHVNPGGSRFSPGDYGMLYLAEDMDTAIAEVTHHHQNYLANIEGLEFDCLVFRGLTCTFSADPIHDASQLGQQHPVHSPDDYSPARAIGPGLRANGSHGVQYLSARRPGSICWGLFTPAGVSAMMQSSHYEFIWSGTDIIHVRKLLAP